MAAFELGDGLEQDGAQAEIGRQVGVVHEGAAAEADVRRGLLEDVLRGDAAAHHRVEVALGEAQEAFAVLRERLAHEDVLFHVFHGASIAHLPEFPPALIRA